MDKLELPAETVTRARPLNLDDAELSYFSHELERSLGPLQAAEGDWDFSREGLLLKVNSGQVDSLSFQSGLPRGTAGAKVWLKGQIYRWVQPQTRLEPVEGRRFLVVTDEFSNGYFHWVADALPKLAWLDTALANYELILPAFAERYRYMSESLALWPQLRYRIVDPRVRSGLAGVVVIPALAPTGNYRPAMMQALRAGWHKKLQPAAPFRRLYISRAKAPWRKISNEAEVEAVLRRHNFETVFLEDLSFDEQARLLSETLHLISNHGAGLTNMAFMPDHGSVTEIRLRGDHANNCYFSLASALNLDYRYLLADVAGSKAQVHVADLVVDPARLEHLLEGFL